MWQTKECIEADDLVILYEGYDNMTYAYMKKDAIFEDRFGIFAHNDM